MNAIGAVLLGVTLYLVWFASPRWALIGMMAGVMYITQGQGLSIAGFNMYAHRFLEIAGFARVMSRGEFSFKRMNTIDRMLLIFYGYLTIVFLIRSDVAQVFQIGVLVDAILCYFTFRGLVGNLSDIKWFLKTYLLLLVPYAGLILIESFARTNVFVSMGGIDYSWWMRGGRPRCTGSFRHASLLGTLGASFIPLYIALGCTRAQRTIAVLGTGFGLAIIWASNSGGPANCAVTAIAGWMLWGLRMHMKFFRWMLVVVILAMAMMMQAPIWYLMAKASSLSGGDGWHRSYLLDIAYQHLDKWWLAGMALRDTWDWFPYGIEATGGADITNQFLSYGITSGLGAMFLFIALLVCSFKRLGRAMAAVRQRTEVSNGAEHMLWGSGVVLALHIMNWLGITYFDQTYLLWFMQLAIVSNLTDEFLSSGKANISSVLKDTGGTKPSVTGHRMAQI